MLIKDRAKRPLIKDIIAELEVHAHALFKESGVKIKFPPPSTSWRDISKKLNQNLTATPEEGY